jgi:two-component system, response regulator
MMTNYAPDILLVEDDPQYADVTLIAFREKNISDSIHLVRDGQEALEFIFCTDRYADRDVNCAQPKVILLDLNLPVLDGHEVLRRLKQDPRTESIPVVMLTSSEEERDIFDSHDFGADHYVVKPLHVEQFSQICHMLKQYGVQTNPSAK